VTGIEWSGAGRWIVTKAQTNYLSEVLGWRQTFSSAAPAFAGPPVEVYFVIAADDFTSQTQPMFGKIVAALGLQEAQFRVVSPLDKTEFHFGSCVVIFGDHQMALTLPGQTLIRTWSLRHLFLNPNDKKQAWSDLAPVKGRNNHA